ncbi:hypothetical protein [Photobacterium nomapromontoriensis]|uniref:hypothetical protein n=1 Tax=Photobacterium nomapromontoriensis TaxID=2910237 RepID=UPI003D0F6241
MKKLLGICTAIILFAPLSLHASNSSGGAQNNPTGPFVDCKLPSGDIEYMPAMFCEIKKGKYQF